MLTNSVKRSLSTTSRLFLAGVLIGAVPATGCSLLFSEGTEQGSGTENDAAIDVSNPDPDMPDPDMPDPDMPDPDASPNRSDGNTTRPDCGPMEAARVIDFLNILADSDWDVTNQDAITPGTDMAIDVAALESGDTASIAHTSAGGLGVFAIDTVIDSIPEDGDSYVRFKLEDTAGTADITMKLYHDRVGGSMSGGGSLSEQVRTAGPYHLRFVRTGDIVRLEHGVDGLNWNSLGEFSTSAPYSLRLAGGRESGLAAGFESNIVIRSIGQDCEI